MHKSEEATLRWPKFIVEYKGKVPSITPFGFAQRASNQGQKINKSLAILILQLSICVVQNLESQNYRTIHFSCKCSFFFFCQSQRTVADIVLRELITLIITKGEEEQQNNERSNIYAGMFNEIREHVTDWSGNIRKQKQNTCRYLHPDKDHSYQMSSLHETLGAPDPLAPFYPGGTSRLNMDTRSASASLSLCAETWGSCLLRVKNRTEWSFLRFLLVAADFLVAFPHHLVHFSNAS